MIVSENTGGAAFTPCPAGTYQARCIRLIDMGTQTSDYQGETKTARKVLMAFEILDLDVRRDDGTPHIISKRFTASLHEKAALRKTLASWRGRDFTPIELKAFDLKAVLGKTCLISLVDNTKDGKTFTNIAAIMAAPKGTTPPEGTCNEPLMHWDMAAPDWTVFSALPARIVEQIEASPEFKALTPPAGHTSPTRPMQAPARPMQAPPPPPAPATKPEQAGAGSGFDDMDDDIPF
ncbi:hypothetical protein [Limnohabitans sp.]|uniref:phage replication initiation protein, NGO0469 family n=1 Tax=Limnohabitans sp. TaxID=1907725 RepID=UPI0025BC73C6|nr:hypothetical protein [Limnohabitans sp.]